MRQGSYYAAIGMRAASQPCVASRSALGSLTLRSLVALAAYGCGNSGQIRELEVQTEQSLNGEDLCLLSNAFADECNPTSCDVVLAEDCEAAASVLNASFVSAEAACIAHGKSPSACFARALWAVTPTPKHEELAAKACQAVTTQAGCIVEFFMREDGEPGIGALALTLSDEVADAVMESCTGEGAEFFALPDCMRGVVEDFGVPEEASQCARTAIEEVQPGEAICGQEFASTSPGRGKDGKAGASKSP